MSFGEAGVILRACEVICWWPLSAKVPSLVTSLCARHDARAGSVPCIRVFSLPDAIWTRFFYLAGMALPRLEISTRCLLLPCGLSVPDIVRLNIKQKNAKVNSKLQNFLFKLIKETEDSTAVKKSMDVMVSSAHAA